MMTNDRIKEAAEWLEQLFDDLSKDPAYEKGGEELLLRVQWEIERYAPELQRAVVDALGPWLLRGERQKAWDALLLIIRMHLKDYIPLLEQMHKDLRANRSTAPKLSLEEVEWALQILKKE